MLKVDSFTEKQLNKYLCVYYPNIFPVALAAIYLTVVFFRNIFSGQGAEFKACTFG